VVLRTLFVSTILIAWTWSPQNAFAGTVNGDLGRRLDTYLARIVPFGFSGAVLVAQNREVVLDKGYGSAIRSSGTPNSAGTVFSTGSLTKQFTAAGILVLEMMGKLHTGDRISNFFDAVPDDKRDITIHHLLTHTAGLPEQSGPDYEEALRDPTVRRILQMPLDFPPGTDFSYSNCGYTLLAAIVEIASGEPYERFLHEHLFQPAGMTLTGYRIPDWDGEVVAHWYVGDTDNGRPLDKPYPYWNLLGNGGILSTTGDMYRWYLALQGDAVLSKAAKKKLWTPFRNEYAYGWDVIELDDGGTLIRHDGGSMLGNSAVMSWFVEEDLLIVTFCNQSFGRNPLFEVIEQNVQRIIRGHSLGVPAVADWPASSAELAACEGTYELPGGGRVKASVYNGALQLRAMEQRAIDALFFPGSEAANGFGALNERTRALIEGALHDDVTPFEKEIPDPKRAAGFERIISREIHRMQNSMGSVVSGVVVIGTVPSSFEGVVATGVQFETAKGTAGRLSVHWRDGRLVGLDQQTFEPVVPFVPAGDGTLAGYHLVWRKGFHVRPVRAGDGGTGALELGRGVVATRID
jgi:CubicO group peptidase (beta-lactamase class C family)